MNPEDDEAGTTVPKKRLDQEIEKRRQASARVGELEQEARDLRASIEALKPKAENHDTLITEIGSLKDQISGLEVARTEDRAIFSRHFDDPDLVRFEHSRISDAPPLGEWLEALTADTAPVSLRGFLAQGTTEASNDTDTETKPKPKRGGTASKGAGGSRAPAGTPAKMTAERAQQIRAKARETGDWSEWRAYRGGAKS